MFDHNTLRRYRQLGEYVRGLQEIGPADEEVGNRLQRASDELAQIEQLARKSRSKAAEGIRATRRILRELGVPIPAVTRPPSASSGERPVSDSGSITYSHAEAGPCLACNQEVGAGLISWGMEPEAGPLCDGCLSKRPGPLSVILMLVNFLREIGEMECEDEEEEQVLRMFLTGMGSQVETLFLGAWHPGPGLPEERLVRLFEQIEERNKNEK